MILFARKLELFRVFFIYFTIGATQLTDKEDFGGAALQEAIDVAYKETSKYLLEILFEKYKFVEHLKVNVLFGNMCQSDATLQIRTMNDCKIFLFLSRSVSP